MLKVSTVGRVGAGMGGRSGAECDCSSSMLNPGQEEDELDAERV